MLGIATSALTRGTLIDGIFWDYKNHFAAYNLDHIVQVDARNDKTINITLQEFLQSYGQSYKEKVKTHNYINRQNQSTTGKL
jgi:hypothetical protein